MKKLLVFLGNPGSQYKGTRHNIAWQICDAFNPIGTWQKKFHGVFLKDGDVIYLKPETFMNESGISVRAAVDFFKIESSSVIVFHDDTQLDFSKVALERAGGLRGHKGLRSIVQHLGTDDFYRLRFGIGRPEKQQDLASFVLGGFTDVEKAMLGDLISQALSLVNGVLNGNG